jgi:hypothetical protein
MTAIRMMKSRRRRCSGNLERVGEISGCKIVIRKKEEVTLHWRK